MPRQLSALHLTRTNPSYTLLSRTIHQRRTLQRQSNPPNPVSHGTESYFVDGDENPPPNDTVFKVDATSDTAQSAYEPPTGPWSRAGTGTEEYRTLSKDEPYELPNSPDIKLRYGGRKRNMEDEGTETIKVSEGLGGSARLGKET